MFALAALSGWQISGLDVKTAFLSGKLDEETYMEQPEGPRTTPPLSNLWAKSKLHSHGGESSLTH